MTVPVPPSWAPGRGTRPARDGVRAPRPARPAAAVVAGVVLAVAGCTATPPSSLPASDLVPPRARWEGDRESSLVLMPDGAGVAERLPHSLSPTCDPRHVVDVSGDVEWEQVTSTEVVLRQGDVSVTVWADREKFSGDPIWSEVTITPCRTGSYGWQSVFMMQVSGE